MLRGDYTCKWDSVITQGKAIAYLVLSLFCSRLWCNWNFSVLALDSAHSLVGVFAFWMVCLVYSHEIQIMGFVLWFMYSPSEWFIWLLLPNSCILVSPSNFCVFAIDFILNRANGLETSDEKYATATNVEGTCFIIDYFEMWCIFLKAYADSWCKWVHENIELLLNCLLISKFDSDANKLNTSGWVIFLWRWWAFVSF